MKRLILTMTTIAGLALLGLAGCKKNEAGEVTVDTAKVQSAFSAATSVDKAEVENAVNAIKANDYATALTSLKKAAENVKLTPEQQQALKDLIAQVQAKLTGASSAAVDKAKAAVDDASKTAGDAAKKASGAVDKALGK